MNYWIRAAGAVIGFGLLGLAFRNVPFDQTGHLLFQLGSVVPVLLVPSVVAVLLESVAWRSAFWKLGAKPTITDVFVTRVASESLSPLLPLGAVWAETLKPVLLKRQAGLSISTSMAGIAARKYLLLASQAGYLALGFVFGRGILASGFGRATGFSALAFFPVGAAIVLGLASEAMAIAFAGGRTFAVLYDGLNRIPSRHFRSFLSKWRADVSGMDGAARDFFAAPLSTRLRLSAPCLVEWLVEASETWLILVALGKSISFGDAIAVESVVVLARHVLVFLPGGLGAQELGYAAFLAGDAASLGILAAFVLLKRLRELAWVIFGYALLTFGARRDERALAGPAPRDAFAGELAP